jgi:hypothetical protein
MPTATASARAPATKPPAAQARPLHPFAGVLSYLVPGLGQIYQGRVGKGVLFLVCIYALFFYGMYQGSGTATVGEKTYRVSGNVYLPDSVTDSPNNTPSQFPDLLVNLYNRPQFVGQFWVGVAAWPAVWQYLNHGEKAMGRRINELKQEGHQEEADALEDQLKERRAKGDPVLGWFERTPDEASLNAVTNFGDKHLELAWVYTVIAGVLNILVIYDAIAGPAFLAPPAGPAPKPVP